MKKIISFTSIGSLFTVSLASLSVFSFSAMAASVGELSGHASVSQGQSGYQIDFQLPQGVNELVPSLSLHYRQGSGNGPLGVGITLGGLSGITRCTRTELDDGVRSGLRFDSSDVYCLDGKRLFLISGKLGHGGSEYRPDGAWQTKVLASGNGTSGPLSWTIYSPEGYISHYGSREDARVSVNNHTMEWPLSQQTDRFNNGINYFYKQHQGQQYIDRIDYADVQIQFRYSGRSDVLTAYRFGQKQVLAQKLDSIDISRADRLLRKVNLHYQNVDTQGITVTRLATVQACDAGGECMPGHAFEWQSNSYAGAEPEQKTLYRLDSFKGFVVGDLNQDGLSDICYLAEEGLYCGLNEGQGRYSDATLWGADFRGEEWQEVQNYSSMALIDINDDRYPDICAFNETGFYCALNRSGDTFENGRYWSKNFTISEAVRLFDANQDGLTDVCRIEDSQVVCANNTTTGLSAEYVLTEQGYPFEKSYKSPYEGMDFYNDKLAYDPVKMPQAQFIDINQDGFVDLCGVKLDGHFYCAMGQQGRSDRASFSTMIRWANDLPVGLTNTATRAVSKKNYDKDAALLRQLQRTIHVADVTGDGLPDLCYRQGDQYLCRQNTGVSFSAPQNWLSLDSKQWEVTDEAGVIEASIMLSDRNNDGLADFCYIVADKVHCAYGNGSAFTNPQPLATIHADLEKIEEQGRYASNFMRKVFGLKNRLHTIGINNIYGPFKRGVDANGDSLTGDCYRSITGLTCLSYEFEPLALLQSVTSGFGVKSEFEYGLTGNSTVFQKRDAPAGLIGLTPNIKVVTALKQDNGIGGVNRKEYVYQGYYAHPDKGLLGFARINVTDKAANTTIMSTNQYHSDGTPYTAHTETRADNRKVTEVHFNYQEFESPVDGKIWPRLVSQQQLSRDLSGQHLLTKTTGYHDYDALGFPGTVTETVKDGNGDQFTETTETQYQHDRNRWLIGKPLNLTVTRSNGYDSQTRRTSFSYDNATGALLRQIIEPGHTLSLTTQFSYNAKGFRVSEQTSGSGQTRGSTTQYDALGRVIKHTNQLGHSVSTRYDSRCGLPAAVTDANNLTTRFEYDSYCREVKQILPDGNWIAQVYQWSDGADAGLDQYGLVLGDRSLFMVTQQTSQGGLSTTYFDKLSREVRTTALNGDGKTVIVDKAYDAQGRLAGETMPYFEGLFAGDATYWVRTEYDALGRSVVKTQATEEDGDLIATTSYYGLSATISGPGRYEKQQQTNGLGQTIQVTENGESQVRYRYDAVGNLIQTDTNGLITELSYNRLGHKTKMADPAMGEWTYGYNAWGELIWQQDAKGQRTDFSYDAIGRKQTETRPDGVSQWHYDGARKGSLDSSSSNGSRRSYSYDALGRTESMTLTIDGNDYRTGYQYNEDGRLSRVIFPSGMNLDKSYDVNGFLKRLSIPNSDIWDSQYLQIEKALKETSERIVELEIQAHELEQNAQFYIEESERLRQAAEQLFARSDQYQNHANKLRSSAYSLFRSANINANRAASYRKTAQYYWRTFGSRVFKHTNTKNGYAYYKFDKCIKKNRKGCKQREYFVAKVPLWMVETRRCYSGKLSGLCVNGAKANINLTQVYNQWANHYQAIANRYRAQGNSKLNSANYYQKLANNNEAQAKALLAQAQANANLARQETDLLSDLTDELDDLVVAEAELQQIMDQRLNDDTAEIVWVATSRDNFGQLSGELFGNGLLTRRDIDRSRGLVTRITTGMGSRYLRDIRYTYDERNNVQSKMGAIRKQEEYYRYDNLDRLTQWSYSNNKTMLYSERDYRYDIYGNLTYKTGQGAFDVSGNGQLKGGYSYDANGNMLSGRGRTIGWNSFNKADYINDNGTVIQYQYGSERERVKQTAQGVTTYYISPEYELELSTNADGKAVTTMRHRFMAGGHAVAEHIKTLVEHEKQIDKTAYFHRDALGSADLITDPNGQVQIEQGYTPFGELLDVVELQADPLFSNDSLRGFTGHENVGGGSGLINMNARLYDPVIGRFLSADSVVPEPGLSQSYNRYAYVMNNPLKYTDPSGHWGEFVIGAIIMAVAMTFENPTIQLIGTVVGSIMMGAGAMAAFGSEGVAAMAASGATTSFTGSYIASGDFGTAVEAGVIGAMAAGVTWQIGHGAGKNWHIGQQAIAHGVAQGGFNELRGGSFQQGFISGVIGKMGGSIVHTEFSDTQQLQRMTGMVAVAGIASAASGASGRDAVMRSAISVVTVYLFNDAAGAEEDYTGGYSPIPGTYPNESGEAVTVTIGADGSLLTLDGTVSYYFDYKTGLLVNPMYTGMANSVCPECYLIGIKSLLLPRGSHVTVTSWAGVGQTADLAAGRWVMIGEATRWNYARTMLWGPQMRSGIVLRGYRYYPMSNSITGSLPRSRIGWPAGLEKWKGIYGQRQIK